MKRVISIGRQDFCSLRENEYFFIDKTYFIRDWWETGDSVTLITRPRRFGKTLNMSMLECFFSSRYENRGDLFEGLSIWEEEKYRKLQGTYPVIFLSFADVKQQNYKDALQKIKNNMAELYYRFSFLGKWEGLEESERTQFLSMTREMSDVNAQDALKILSGYLKRYYGKNVIILLDEYDTPMQEAYLGGYWKEFTEFIRSLFNATFKTNPYLERAVMTGVTRVSKESIFSDLNNLKVVTTTSRKYATCFGFTEEEVFASLDEMELSEEKDNVKKWYDGFTFGKHTDIYNPWSITNFLDEKRYATYWASTSSNSLVGRLLQTASTQVKQMMEQLMNGNAIRVEIDEQIVFHQLDEREEAIWSLLLASGYLKAEQVIEYEEDGEPLDLPEYVLKITNREVRNMFLTLFHNWFGKVTYAYNNFVKAMLRDDIEEMNAYMNQVALATFSSFDTGRKESETTQPERFYHGFVLGLLVELRKEYEVISNGESGFGRYDVMLMPKKPGNAKTPGIILEFKVHQPAKERSLEETVEAAKKQIKEKAYATRLIEHGVPEENIRHYGFAFEGKTVLIG